MSSDSRKKSNKKYYEKQKERLRQLETLNSDVQHTEAPAEAPQQEKYVQISEKDLQELLLKKKQDDFFFQPKQIQTPTAQPLQSVTATPIQPPQPSFMMDLAKGAIFMVAPQILKMGMNYIGRKYIAPIQPPSQKAEPSRQSSSGIEPFNSFSIF